MTEKPSAAERHWATQWANAGRAMTAVRACELRELSDAAALQSANDLLSLFDPGSIPHHRIISSGLLEFQASAASLPLNPLVNAHRPFRSGEANR